MNEVASRRAGPSPRTIEFILPDKTPFLAASGGASFPEGHAALPKPRERVITALGEVARLATRGKHRGSTARESSRRHNHRAILATLSFITVTQTHAADVIPVKLAWHREGVV